MNDDQIIALAEDIEALGIGDCLQLPALPGRKRKVLIERMFGEEGSREHICWVVWNTPTTRTAGGKAVEAARAGNDAIELAEALSDLYSGKTR